MNPNEAEYQFGTHSITSQTQVHDYVITWIAFHNSTTTQSDQHWVDLYHGEKEPKYKFPIIYTYQHGELLQTYWSQLAKQKATSCSTSWPTIQ